MVWSKGPVDDRKKMIEMYEREGLSKSELARRLGVTRQCVHKWLGRYAEEGVDGLADHSRAPLYRPRATDPEVVRALVDLKHRHGYGPDKLVVLLEKERGVTIPASTARDILNRHGLTGRRGRRRPCWSPTEVPQIIIPGPGHTMSADHKGKFRLGNGRYCYPLTLSDPAARWVHAIQALASTQGFLAKPVFERVFAEYGLPEQILTDNGPPFSGPSVGGLSELSAWWIRLAIRPIRIERGRPQQNGVHERMHRTLKEATIVPPASTMQGQQRRFNAFRHEFNHVRPHQALGQRPPAEVMQPYRRSLPAKIPPIEYSAYFDVRRVRSNGEIKWQGLTPHVTTILIGEPVGLRRRDDGTWELHYGAVHLADWSEDDEKFVPPQVRAVKATGEP